MLRATVILASTCFLACARTDVPTRAKLVRPVLATGPKAPSDASDCEHIPVDLAEGKDPYPGSVSWSGDGTLVAAVIGQSGQWSSHVEGADGVVIWSVADGVARKRYRITAQAVAFAHHGERLAFASIWDSGVIDLRTDCAQRWPQRGPLLAWGSDDRTIFVVGRVVGESPGILSIDPTTGALLRQWTAPEPSPRFVSMDASSTALAIGDEFHVVRIVSPDLSQTRMLPGAGNAIANARAVAIAPNGKLVASGVVEEIPVKYPANVMPGPSRHRFFVRILSLPDGEARVFPGDPEALAFSPDSTFLAIAGMLDSRLIIRTLATNEMQVLDDKVLFPSQIAWAPDGRSLALADWRGAIRLYDTSGGGSPRILKP